MNNTEKIKKVETILNWMKALPNSPKTTKDWAKEIVTEINENELVSDLNKAIISQKNTINALNAEIESLTFGGKPEDYLIK